MNMLLAALALASGGALGLFGRFIRVRPLAFVFTDKLFWALLLPAAFLARLPLLLQSLWYDETFTRAMVTTPLERFLPALLGDVHPPGYYLLARLAAFVFGPSAAALRLPSLLAGMALIMLVYRVGLLLHGSKGAAQFGALITAFLPASLYYSAEARYPAILALLALASAYALLANRPGLFAAVTGLLAWFHSIGMVYVGLLVLAALARRQPRWAAAALAAGLIAAAWLPGLLAQSSDVSNGFWLLNSAPLWHLLDMTTRRAVGLPELLPVVWGAPLFISALGIAAARKWLRGQPLWVLLAVGLPGLLWAIGYVWQPVYLSRSLIAPALLMVIVWGWFLAHGAGALRLLAGALLAVAVGVGNTYLYSNDRSSVDDLIAANCQGANYIYATSTNMGIMGKASGLPVVLWPDSDNLHQSLTASARAALGFSSIMTAGDVCYIVQLSYYTTEGERARLAQIRAAFPGMAAAYIEDEFIQYMVLRFRYD